MDYQFNFKKTNTSGNPIPTITVSTLLE